jgi:hypothetical protein
LHIKRVAEFYTNLGVGGLSQEPVSVLPMSVRQAKQHKVYLDTLVVYVDAAAQM